MKLEQTQADINAYGRKYNFYYNEESKTIVCATLYKGQPVRGIAKCDPDDVFDIDLGKKLSYLRCVQKFAQKKLKHAQNVKQKAFDVVVKSRYSLYKACQFVADAELQFDVAMDELVKFESKLNN